ncbi:MAG: hypothetical protein ABIN96_12795 [Rubrivivax sp.]
MALLRAAAAAVGDHGAVAAACCVSWWRRTGALIVLIPGMVVGVAGASPPAPHPVTGPAAPSVGAASTALPFASRTLDQALARHRRQLQRCDRVQVAAVGAECRRQADRDLQADR